MEMNGYYICELSEGGYIVEQDFSRSTGEYYQPVYATSDIDDALKFIKNRMMLGKESEKNEI